MAITRGGKDSSLAKEEISMSEDGEGPNVDMKSTVARRRKRKIEGDAEDKGRKQRKIIEGKDKLKQKAYNDHIRYRFYTGEAFYGRININSRKCFITEIEKRLTTTDWERILIGPFGKCVKMLQEVTYSAQIVHGVLLRQLETNKKWETCYGVGGKELRFSMKEYCQITGLNCDPLPTMKDKGAKAVMETFFGEPGGENISVQDLYERFKDARDDSNYKFKLALLLILEGVILGGDKKRKVNFVHVKLIQNMDRFNAYPWGRVGYLELNKSLTVSLKKRMETFEKTKLLSKEPRIPYSIQGMAIAFQIWMYEAIPRIEGIYATKLNDNKFPRGLRWYSEEEPDHDNVEGTLSDDIVICKSILVPEEEEDEMVSKCNFSDEENDEYFDNLVRNIERNTKGKKGRRKQSKVDGGSSLIKKEEYLDPSTVMCAITDLAKSMKRIEDSILKRLQELEERMDKLELPKRKSTRSTEMDKSLQSSSHEVDSDNNGKEKCDDDTWDDQKYIGVDLHGGKSDQGSLEEVPQEEGHLSEEEVSKKSEKAPQELGKKSEEEVSKKSEEEEGGAKKTTRSRKVFDGPKRVLSKRKKEKSKHMSSPYIDLEQPQKTVITYQRAVKVSKKAKAGGNTSEIADLIDWLESKSDDVHSGPSGIELNKEFFSSLIEPQKWLSSEHMEQVLHFLRQIVQDKKYKNVVILDIFWVNQMITEWENHEFSESSDIKGKILHKYCKGLLPQEHGKSWEDAEVIYVPFNLKTKHWVALHINLKEWCVYVYDSAPDLTKSDDLTKLLEPVTKGLLLVLKKFEPLNKVLEKCGEKPLSVSSVPGLKNVRSGDCGVFALKYIEYLSTGKTNLEMIADKFIDAHRRNLAQSIWKSEWISL